MGAGVGTASVFCRQDAAGGIPLRRSHSLNEANLISLSLSLSLLCVNDKWKSTRRGFHNARLRPQKQQILVTLGDGLRSWPCSQHTGRRAYHYHTTNARISSDALTLLHNTCVCHQLLKRELRLWSYDRMALFKFHYYYFFTLGRYVPESLKIRKMTRKVWPYDHQSVQSEAGKLFWSKTALKRCTSTEHLWKRKPASLTSPELHVEKSICQGQRGAGEPTCCTRLKSLQLDL